MRKFQLLLLCLCSFLTARGQYWETFQDYDEMPCPFDGAQTVLYPKGWMLYQTTNGAWDGPVDSTRCISVEPYGISGRPRVDLGQIDPAQPLFIRAEASEFASIGDLTPNALYSIIADTYVSDTAALPLSGSDCVQDLCSGVFVGISVPGDMRIHTGLIIEDNFPATSLYVGACFPTEYFAGQQLAELILKYTFPPAADLNGYFLYLETVSVDGSFPPGLIAEVPAGADNYNSVSGEYDVNVAEVASGPFFYENFLLQYTAPTFPSAQNPSYVVGSVVPNSPEQEVINLVVDEFQTLEIQPFTYLIGDLVEGSDTLRHQVNLVNNGGEICLNFIDFVLDGGDEYRHGGGSLTMNNAFSCMQFRNGSILRVLEGAALRYGNGGSGMLALCANSTIAIERDATLIVDCVLNIAECNDALPPQQIYMDLPPGSKLIFTDRARLTNRFSQGQQMLLNVRMLGGTIDDASLAPEDRALIRRIYPDPKPGFAANVTLSPNPFAETLTLSYLAEKPETLTLRWFALNGQAVREESLYAARGFNEWQPASPEAAGMYLLEIDAEAGKMTKKMVKTGRNP